MKGTVVATWLNSAEKLYGQEIVEKSLRENNWPIGKLITPLEDIPDVEPFNIMKSIARYTQKSVEDVWREIGRHNIKSFAEWYPSYFERSNLRDFIFMMDELHTQLTKKIPGALPPRLIPTILGPQELEIEYISHRGMFSYFLGLLEGASEFFKEKLVIEILDKGQKEGKPYLKVRLKFEKGNEYIKRYRLNQVLAAGFLHSIPLRTGLASGVLSWPLFLLAAADFNLVSLVYAALTGAVAGAVSYISFKPLKGLKTQAEYMQNFDFASAYRIATGDELETISESLNKLKENIQKDFLYLKGGTDDLYTFSSKFSKIAKEMGNVSEVISSVVHQVAEGAVYQAEETEKSVSTLTQNIEQLNHLAQRELEAKENLSQAVENIKRSFSEVKGVASLLLDTKEQFKNVNQQGEDLAGRVQNIMEIVTTVEGIADQTNLLALNAAIEAARAGEQGRGFAVVAEEIRKLADDVKQAVKTINENLQYFINEVSKLVRDISEQFVQLERSNQSLEKAVEDNMKSTEEIDKVAYTIVDLVEELSKETQHISEVFQNLHTLAAIAQENSASSEEMSANVAEYSDKIKELTSYVEQLEKLTEGFRQELRKYKI
ncbi:methyl-accepting chemotaxis protein [Thermosyntropha lipolytica DSM 11003]|uniref:Methyl-accepting chemotaxis protein n=1 Tax=Thermosyntropha lipolytica DSM 11003 TaxID=1123382 RepID=A0A1M5PMN1_9FIRM|nr:heme NO-binding domain-containing protein [Thermosyntropha lipolytica]SHH02473.1 methyl-accepting chemotaxis protein [Thermosyntropha lipolytica DSM 11003]